MIDELYINKFKFNKLNTFSLWLQKRTHLLEKKLPQ